MQTWNDLEDSNRAFMAADPGAAKYFEASRKHGLVFQACADANDALKSSARKMYSKAAEFANLPPDHPLWKLAARIEQSQQFDAPLQRPN